MPSVPINGTEVFHEVDGDGLSCLVLHGGLGVDHTLYRRTLGRLASSMRLVFFDHRCNGRSGRPPLTTLTIEQLAADAVGLADHLGLDRFRVLGHSYGGLVAHSGTRTASARSSSSPPHPASSAPANRPTRPSRVRHRRPRSST